MEQDEAGEFEGNIKNVIFNRLSIDSQGKPRDDVVGEGRSVVLGNFSSSVGP